MPKKLTKKLKVETVGINPKQHVLILQKEDFPREIHAGMIDEFIEANYPNLVSRNPNQVNGVSVSRDEIVITLSHSISQNQEDEIIDKLQNNNWQY